MSFPKKLTRRSVLQGSALAGALTATAPLAQADHHGKSKTQGLLSDGSTILFQGDSITDAGRDKKNQVANKQEAFGRGYAWMAASQRVKSARSGLSCRNVWPSDSERPSRRDRTSLPPSVHHTEGYLTGVSSCSS